MELESTGVSVPGTTKPLQTALSAHAGLLPITVVAASLAFGAPFYSNRSERLPVPNGVQQTARPSDRMLISTMFLPAPTQGTYNVRAVWYASSAPAPVMRTLDTVVTVMADGTILGEARDNVLFNPDAEGDQACGLKQDIDGSVYCGGMCGDGEIAITLGRTPAINRIKQQVTYGCGMYKPLSLSSSPVCQCGTLLLSSSISDIPIQIGATITVSLRAAPGSEEDANVDNNHTTLLFNEPSPQIHLPSTLSGRP